MRWKAFYYYHYYYDDYHYCYYLWHNHVQCVDEYVQARAGSEGMTLILNLVMMLMDPPRGQK